VQLVILAAGHGRRFGGLKQLAPVGPRGEAIMDYTVATAESCGYDSIVVIVRDDIRAEIERHIKACWPSTLPVHVLCQPPVPGTAQAVLAARPSIDGPFAVANADDLYGEDALVRLAAHFSPAPDDLGQAIEVANRHVLISFRLAHTVLNDRPVTRGLCELLDDDGLAAIVEHTVVLREDGRFEARPLPSNELHAHTALHDVAPRSLSGDEPTSMNLWGFHPRMLDHLEAALEDFDPSTAARPELLLPDVMSHLVTSGLDFVQVSSTESRCIGITHHDDLAMVQEELAFAAARAGAVRTAPGS
jgi:CTP:molybdopterin cytidylyltransferase MocA